MEARDEAVTSDDICTFIYTSGTTGPPKGCVIRHGNYRSMLDMVNETSVIEEEDLTYLYLPLAHSFALLIQLGSFDLGATIAYWQHDPNKIMPNMAELKPTYFPSVPRIFEKIYTAANSGMEKEGGLKKVIFDWSIKTGEKVRAARTGGGKPGWLLQPPVRASPTKKCSPKSAACSAATCASRSPARRRSTRTSCASSMPPASSWSRAGG